MADQYDKFWNQFADGLRRSRGLYLETSAQADAAFRNAPEVPLSSSEISDTLQEVLSGELATWESLSSFDEIPSASHYSQEVFQARNDDAADEAQRRDILDDLKRRHRSGDEEREEERGDSERPSDQ
jgi:hypothetical protein